MALSIKDPETERLARALAKRTGESLTIATRRALEERLRRIGATRAGRRCLRILPRSVAAGAHCLCATSGALTRSSATTRMGCPADGDRHLSYCRHRTQRTGVQILRAAHCRCGGSPDFSGDSIRGRNGYRDRLGTRGGIELDLWLHKVEVEIVPVDAEQADQARRAWRRFGKGRHPAGLNLGDCFSYALSVLTQEPLLFKGDDFSKTDIEAA